MFEEKRYKAHESKLLQYVLKIQRSEIMMQAVIKSKLMNQKDRKLFKMNSAKVAKKFNLLVGNERVRAADLIQFMIKPKENFDVNFDTFVLGSSDKYFDFFLNHKIIGNLLQQIICKHRAS